MTDGVTGPGWAVNGGQHGTKEKQGGRPKEKKQRNEGLLAALDGGSAATGWRLGAGEPPVNGWHGGGVWPSRGEAWGGMSGKAETGRG